MDPLDKLMEELEAMKKLLNGPDSWMDVYSDEELAEIANRARTLAANLSGLQEKLRRKA